MKLHYYLMSMALAVTASVSFTACDDDDPIYEPVTVIQPGDAPGNIEFTKDTIQLFIGESAALPVAVTDGVRATSLDPSVCEIVNENGALAVKALSIGRCHVMVIYPDGTSDAFFVRSIKVDKVTLSESQISFETPALLGWPCNGEYKFTIEDGNGDYTVKCPSEFVTLNYTRATGEVSVTAVGPAEAVSTDITVTDCMGYSKTVRVNIAQAYTMPFTQDDINRISGLTSSEIMVYGVHDAHYLNENTPFYFFSPYSTDPTNWINSNADGMHTFGWNLTNYGGFKAYGGFMVDYPETAQVGQEVQGTWKFAYSTVQWWPVHNYSGTVKVVEDNDQRQVVVFYGINANRPVVDYGYCVYVK